MDDVLPNGTAVTVPLVTNGASVEVTDKNKAEYANKLAQYRLQGAVQREVRKLPLFDLHHTTRRHTRHRTKRHCTSCATQSSAHMARRRLI